jgi:hypothetical protein
MCWRARAAAVACAAVSGVIGGCGSGDNAAPPPDAGTNDVGGDRTVVDSRSGDGARDAPPDTSADVASDGGGGTPFDFYVSPTGDDDNTGSLTSPWSITALCTMPNRTTTACKWSTYGGKRVGLVPGTYTQGKYMGTVTTLKSLMDGGAGLALYINGGPSASSPTVIASCDANGLSLPANASRTAIIDFSSGTGKTSQLQADGIGQAPGDGTHMAPNMGNWTLDGLEMTGFSKDAVVVNYFATPISNVTVKNCELHGGNSYSNNNPGAIYASKPSNLKILNNKIHDCFATSNMINWAVSGSISGGVMTVTSFLPGWPPPSTEPLTVGMNVYLATSGKAAGTITSFRAGTGSTGTYNVSVSGTYPSQTIYLGTDSAFPSWGYWAWSIFNSDIDHPTTVMNNTLYNMGVAGHKDHYQTAEVSYNYFEFGSWGTTPQEPGCSPPKVGAGGYQNLISAEGTTESWHHNIVVGPSFIDGKGEDGLDNQGTINCYHNTFYAPSTSTHAPQLLRVSNDSSPAGTWEFHDNVLWSDGPAWSTDPGTFEIDTGFTTGIANAQWNYNALQSLVTYSPSYSTGESLAAWQSGTGNDANSKSLTATPFATTPSSRNIDSFSVSGPAAKASTTGGPSGALDGTTSPLGYGVGTNF